MTESQDGLQRLPCAIECMVFNETALTLVSLIDEELEGQEQLTHISLNNLDMSGIEFYGDNDPVVCKDGWSLN